MMPLREALVAKYDLKPFLTALPPEGVSATDLVGLAAQAAAPPLFHLLQPKGTPRRGSSYSAALCAMS